jgi:hypothetical protein
MVSEITFFPEKLNMKRKGTEYYVNKGMRRNVPKSDVPNRKKVKR